MTESFLTKWERVIKAQPLDLRSDETKFWHAQIDKAVERERERCAEIVHSMARAQVCQRRTNKMGRYAADLLVACRDKIRAATLSSTAKGGEN